MAGCCVLPLCCFGSSVCFTLGVFSVGGDGSCGKAMLNMADSCFSADICFYPSCRMGLGSGDIL